MLFEFSDLMKFRHACIATSAPDGIQTPIWCGWNSPVRLRETLNMQAFPAKRLKVFPTAIGLTPPSFFERAIKEAPKTLD